MYVDANLRFSNAQAITAAARSTNQYNQGMANRDLGTGKPLFLVTVVTTAFADSGSNSTLTVSLGGDTTSTITPDKERSLFVIPALAAVGDTFIAPLHPKGDVEQYQYLDVGYSPNNGDLSAGAVTTFLTEDVQAWAPKAKNYTIS